MSLPSEQSYISYSGNGSTSTPYPIPFKFYTSADIQVVVTNVNGEDTTLIPVTDYAVTGGNAEAGGTGNLTTTVAIPSTKKVTINRLVALTQGTTFTDIGKFPSQAVDRALDRLTMQVQQIDREVTLKDSLIDGGGA